MALAVNEAFEDIDMEEGGLRFSLGSIAAMTTLLEKCYKSFFN